MEREVNLDKKTAILYEAFEILTNIAMYTFVEPYSPNEARAWKLIQEMQDIYNEEQLEFRKLHGHSWCKETDNDK